MALSSLCYFRGRIHRYGPALFRLAPHRHSDSAFVYAYVVSGQMASQVESQPEHIYRAGVGAGSLLYAAEVHGFGSCPMIGFDPVAVASEFSLLPDEIPVLLVAIGRAATDNWPQKSRRPLTEVLSFA